MSEDEPPFEVIGPVVELKALRKALDAALVAEWSALLQGDVEAPYGEDGDSPADAKRS